jgi:hypothetical protein
MQLDTAAIAKVTRAFKPSRYARLFEVAYRATPLGTGPSSARFSSEKGNFHTLYAARSLATAIAERVIRDRFEGGGMRLLFGSELAEYCVASISAMAPLQLLDLRTDGCFQLGVSTDIASAKSPKGWDEARALAQYIHDETTLDGFLYRSRLTAENCVAIFDRAIHATLSAGKGMDLVAMPRLSVALCKLNIRLQL